MSYLLAFFTILFFLARTVQTQKNFAACSDDSYRWTFNSEGESPCGVATDLGAVCAGPSFTTWPLPTGISYWGPQRGFDTPCLCSTVTWSIYSACGACQNESVVSWSFWAYNCSAPTIGGFPLNTPQQLVIPHWAYLSVGDAGVWNETAANADALNPVNSQNPHHTRVGAIVGGVIGGLAAFAVVVALFVVLYRRFSRRVTERPQSTLYEPEGASFYKPSGSTGQPSFVPGHSVRQELYDPSKPSTYPPPLNYNRSSVVYTTSPEGPGNYSTANPPLR